VTPRAVSFEPGDTIQLTGVGRDTKNRELSGGQLTWWSADPGIATVSPLGLVTGASLGTTTIHVKLGAVQDSMTLRVIRVHSELQIGPQSVRLAGTRSQLSGEAFNISSQTWEPVVPTWSVSNSAVAAVSSSGMLTAKRSGTISISASWHGYDASLSLTIVEFPGVVAVGKTDGHGNQHIEWWALGSTEPWVSTVATRPLGMDLSPDRATVVAVCGTPPVICLIRPGDTTPRLLVPGTAPSWSADGARIVYTAPDTTFRLISADGALLQTIPVRAGSDYPRLDPLGQRILYRCSAPVGTLAPLCLTSVAPPYATSTLPTKARDGAVWHPNGLVVTYADENEIATIDLIDGDAYQVLDPLEQPGPLAWNTDGHWLAVGVGDEVQFTGVGYFWSALGVQIGIGLATPGTRVTGLAWR
jgi:hypothetical protein